MTDVVLARHGETVWHAENRYAGRSDVALTDRGRAQADRLGAWAATADLTALWCSPLQRAHDTALAVRAATGLEARIDRRLRELDFGDGEGLTRTEMRAAFPAALEAFEADPVAHHLPGGEAPGDAAARMVDALEDIAAAHPRERVLVVAHTTVIRLALCRLLGVPLRSYRRTFPQLDNVTRTEVRLGAGAPALLAYNAPLEHAAAA